MVDQCFCVFTRSWSIVVGFVVWEVSCLRADFNASGRVCHRCVHDDVWWAWHDFASHFAYASRLHFWLEVQVMEVRIPESMYSKLLPLPGEFHYQVSFTTRWGPLLGGFHYQVSSSTRWDPLPCAEASFFPLPGKIHYQVSFIHYQVSSTTRWASYHVKQVSSSTRWVPLPGELHTLRTAHRACSLRTLLYWHPWQFFLIWHQRAWDGVAQWWFILNQLPCVH